MRTGPGSRSMLNVVTVELTDFALCYTLQKTSSNCENRKPTRLIIPISSAVFAPNGGQHLFSEICKRERRERVEGGGARIEAINHAADLPSAVFIYTVLFCLSPWRWGIRLMIRYIHFSRRLVSVVTSACDQRQMYIIYSLLLFHRSSVALYPLLIGLGAVHGNFFQLIWWQPETLFSFHSFVSEKLWQLLIINKQHETCLNVFVV